MSSDFFDATTELQTVHQWARARFAAPWALFLAVLGRVLASTSPGVQLPGVIGGPASLNMITAFVAPSGGGKGVTDRVAREVWPTPIIERPIGSGEGIAALFAPPKKESVERITQAILHAPEIDTLAGIASRQGNILLAQLKSAVMGELIGQSNASEATSRIVLPHTYRCVMSIGAQPGHCDVIFNDASGGTPQRVVWALTVDKDMPAEAPPDPDPLNTRLPAWTRTNTVMTYGPSEIREQIITAHLARQRGEADALDGHRMLTRCKIAAGLAIMHHRSVVTELDWQLSEEVMAHSDKTRNWVVEEAAQAARAKVRDRAMARARGEQFVSDHRQSRAKSAVLRWLSRDGELPANQLRSKIKAELRDHFGAAIAELVADGLVLEIRVDRGTRYRLDPEVQGVPPVQGQSQQVSEGVLEVQAVPADNVTDLDSRRSHESPASTLTAREWFADYIAGLQEAGHTTARSADVMKAGEVAGFTRNNLRQASSAHPDVQTISRKGGTATWSITPGAQVPDYVGAAQWLEQYVDRQSNPTVYPDDVRIAGEAAGHAWHSVRRAAGDSARIKSIPAHGDSKTERIWKILPITEKETSA